MKSYRLLTDLEKITSLYKGKSFRKSSKEEIIRGFRKHPHAS